MSWTRPGYGHLIVKMATQTLMKIEHTATEYCVESSEKKSLER